MKPASVLGETSRTAEPWPVGNELRPVLEELPRRGVPGEPSFLANESAVHALLTHAPMILWAVDRTGRITRLEGAGLSVLDLHYGDGMGRTAFDRGLGAHLEGESLRRILERESVAFELELDALAWFDTRCEPLVGPNGEVDGAMGLSIDITARRRAERERDRHLRAVQRVLRGERAARRRALFLEQASRVLAGSIDQDQDATLLSIAHLIVPEIADGCVVDIVDARGAWRPVVAYRDAEREREVASIAQRVGHAPNTTLGRVATTGEPFFAPQLDAASGYRIAAPSEAARELLCKLQIASLVIVQIKARGRILGLLSLFTGRESERLLEQEDVEFASDLAVHAGLAIDNARMFGEQTLAVQRRDEFLSVAAHELRTPLTSVRLAVQMLARSRNDAALGASAPARETSSTLLKTAERQTLRLGQLVENLLDVSRIATGQLVMNIDPVDLSEVVRDAVASLPVDTGRNPTSAIELTIEREKPVIGNWDRVRLEQVITNLLSNALKYGRDEPVEVRVMATENVARLEVEDHGIGIDQEHQESIFDRFERAVSSRHYGGFGLGLYIVKQIVTALGGRIEVWSKLGAGSIFTVTLPLGGPPFRTDGPSRRS